MQRMSFVVLFVCLLLGKAASRQLTQDDKPTVTATSNSNSQGGSALTITFATSRVRTEVTNPLAEAVGESINVVSGGGDVDAQVDITATAIARAIITIALGAEVDATVEGTGTACGKATVSISRTLTVVAEAVAKAFAQAENDLIRAQGDSVAKAIQEATVSLDASVSAEACSQGGTARAAQTLKGSKGLEATAQAIARAYAIISKGDDADSSTESISKANVKETGTLTGDTRSTVTGLGSANAGAVANFSICTADEVGCCDPNRRFMGFCYCGPGCSIVSFPSGGNKELILRTSSNEEKKCLCN